MLFPYKKLGFPWMESEDFFECAISFCEIPGRYLRWRKGTVNLTRSGHGITHVTSSAGRYPTGSLGLVQRFHLIMQFCVEATGASLHLYSLSI